MKNLSDEQCQIVAGGEVGATGMGDDYSYTGYYSSGLAGCTLDALYYTGGPMAGTGASKYWERFIECMTQ